MGYIVLFSDPQHPINCNSIIPQNNPSHCGKLVCHSNLSLINLDYEIVRRVERALEIFYGLLQRLLRRGWSVGSSVIRRKLQPVQRPHGSADPLVAPRYHHLK